jgi:hypothetical protein
MTNVAARLARSRFLLCSLRARVGMTISRKQGAFTASSHDGRQHAGATIERIRVRTAESARCYGASTASLASSDRVLSLPRSSTAETEYQYVFPVVTFVSRKAEVFTSSVLIFAGWAPSSWR